MQNVILVVHILACIALTVVVLLQRSEGGALGIGGGGSGGGLMSGRGAAGALVRTTMIAAGIFFITSLTLTTIATHDGAGQTDVDRALEGQANPDGPAADGRDPTVPLLDEPLLEETPVEVDVDPLFETPLDETPDTGASEPAPDADAPTQPQ